MDAIFYEYNFQQWLDYIQEQHPNDIELGLERISSVVEKLNLNPTDSKIVIIGGTNGKGTTLAILESLAIENKQTVLSYSSPHIFKFNERIRINGLKVSDELLIQSFLKIESARENIPLTFFEFTTLSAMLIQSEINPDIALYEIGLGGRLDAVNILQPEISIVTSIAMDHVDWLGDSIDKIAYEKLAIGRKDKPLLVAESKLSRKSQDIAELNSQHCFFIGKDFGCKFVDDSGNISKHNNKTSAVVYFNGREISLELPDNIHPSNFAVAVYAASLMKFALNKSIISQCLNKLFLPARYQCIHNNPTVILDVSHNSQAIECLHRRMTKLNGPIKLVCGMLSDKLMKDVLLPLLGHNYDWYLVDLDVPRGATSDEIEQQLFNEVSIQKFPSVRKAMIAAIEDAQQSANVVVFGSFITVELAGCFMDEKSTITTIPTSRRKHLE